MSRCDRLAKLGVEVEALRESGSWVAYLRMASKFHQYSANNLMLIALQCPDATRVAGYRKWQEMGRQVRKGSKAIRIFGPWLRKDDEGEQRLVGYRVLSVFDVSQTDGDPLPEHPEWPVLDVPVGDLWSRMLAACADADVEVVEVGDRSDGARGWLDTRSQQISIVGSFPESQKVATLFHELGHRFDPSLSDDRAANELVAESVSFLLAERVDLDSKLDQTLVYLASWGGTTDALLAVAERVRLSQKAIEHTVFARVARKEMEHV